MLILGCPCFLLYGVFPHSTLLSLSLSWLFFFFLYFKWIFVSFFFLFFFFSFCWVGTVRSFVVFVAVLLSAVG